MTTDNKRPKNCMLEIFTPETLHLYVEGKLCNSARLEVEALIKSDDRAARYLAAIASCSSSIQAISPIFPRVVTSIPTKSTDDAGK